MKFKHILNTKKLKKVKFVFLLLAIFTFSQNPIFSQKTFKNSNINTIVENSRSISKQIPNHQKLDSFSRILLNKENVSSKYTIAKKFNLSAKINNNKKISADFFIQLEDNSGTTNIADLGVKIRTQIGNIVIVNTELENLISLLKLPEVKRIEISHKGSAKLDSSRANIRADLVHQGFELPQAYKGEDVILGIIDSGIDFKHPDFSDENGTRILYLKEYTDDGGEIEWTKEEIDSNPKSVVQVDGNGQRGHGTHVAGIAAGNGRSNSKMVGIAPKSDIIFVKVFRDPEGYGFFNDVDLVAGCLYIFNKAQELGKPAVINLSLGHQFGPHDGTSLYEQALTELTGPGRIIVAAAGNEGSYNIHAGGTSVSNSLNETLIIADSSSQYAAITMWYKPDVVKELAVFAYDDQFNFIGQSTIINVGSSPVKFPFVIDNDTLGYITVDALTENDPNNNDGNALFLIENMNSPNIDISKTIWSIGSRGTNSGRMDLWVYKGGSFYDDIVGFQGETEMPGNNKLTVGPPATAKKIVSVGAFATKNNYVDIDGTGWIFNSVIINDLFSLSSRGPTRDGRLSPQITAPGLIIFSTLSSQLTEGIGYFKSNVLEGGNYIWKLGTSMASPHVAGTIALMLQIKNDLTYEEVIQYFSESSRSNQFTGIVPNNNVGWGYLDTYEVINKMSNLVGNVVLTNNKVPESFQLLQNYPNPFNPSTTIKYTIPSRDVMLNSFQHLKNSEIPNQVRDDNQNIKLIIYDVLGRKIKTLINSNQSAGNYSVEFDASNLPSGIYYYQLNTDSFVKTKKMMLLK